MPEPTREESSLLHWLRRYKPAKVRMHSEAWAEPRMLDRPAQDRGRWTMLEHAITSLAPTYVEALDDAGAVVASRAEQGPEVQAPAAAPPVVPDNPMSALVATMPTLVQLIVDAADASAARHADAYRLAFEQQLSLVKVLADRLHGLEKAYQSVLMSQAQASGVSDQDALLAQVVGHAMAGNGAPAPKKDTPQ